MWWLVLLAIALVVYGLYQFVWLPRQRRRIARSPFGSGGSRTPDDSSRSSDGSVSPRDRGPRAS